MGPVLLLAVRSVVGDPPVCVRLKMEDCESSQTVTSRALN